MSATFTMLPVGDIVFDSQQPRKFFDELAMKELTESVREIGILQPILVRPGATIRDNGKDRKAYIIISGERRYRAAFAAELTEVPCVIREGLSDQEILEIQITENLQRKDVNPMEEGVAFEQLRRTYSAEEIAHRVGKSAQYVAQRISLTNLTDAWQQIMFDGKITLTLAYKLARIAPEVQNEAYKECVSNGKIEYEWKLHRVLDEDDHNLDSAIFSTEDEELYPEAGPCGSCRYNSANDNLLFPDLNQKRICHNSACWAIKSQRAYKVTLEEKVSDPNMVFVSACYSPDKEEKAKIQAAEELGVKVLGYGDYEVIEEPTPVGTLEEFLAKEKEESDWDEWDAAEQKEAMNDWREEYSRQKDEYVEDKALYDRDIQDAVKAFVVAGDRWNAKEGSIVYIKPKKGKSEHFAAAQVNGNPELEQVKLEIASIEQKRKRNQELDREKVFKLISEELKKEDGSFLSQKGILAGTEHEALILAMVVSSYRCKETVSQELNKGYDYNCSGLYEDLRNYGDIQKLLSIVARSFILDKLNSAVEVDPKRHDKAAALYHIAIQYFPGTVEQMEMEQKQKAEKREKNVQARLDALNTKLKELKASQPKADTDASGKKAKAKKK